MLFLNNYLKSQGLKGGSDSDSDDDEDEDDDDKGALNEDGMDVDWSAMESDDFDGSDTEEDEEDDASDDDGRAAIERLKDDLFAEDEGDAGPSDMSAHEKRMAALSEQIRELETENVGPREWTLMGEATARARPANALLEQDLDFERAARPVPQVTEERVSSIEELVKKRILEVRPPICINPPALTFWPPQNNFDDVQRKRPDVGMAPRKEFELSDQKSQRSLAQLYEDEYTATRAGTSRADDRDGKLAKEHAELEQLWEGISYKLDALCNAHFTPKAVRALVTCPYLVADAPRDAAADEDPDDCERTRCVARERAADGACGGEHARSGGGCGAREQPGARREERDDACREACGAPADEEDACEAARRGRRGAGQGQEQRLGEEGEGARAECREQGARRHRCGQGERARGEGQAEDACGREEAQAVACSCRSMYRSRLVFTDFHIQA